jgi:hypothetical protein
MRVGSADILEAVMPQAAAQPHGEVAGLRHAKRRTDRAPRSSAGDNAGVFRDSARGMRNERKGLQLRRWKRPCARLRIAFLPVALLASIGAILCARAQAQKLEVKYVMSMTGIRVGQSTWTAAFDGERYSAGAIGGAVDLLSVLVRGEGVAQVSGLIKEGRLVPAAFSSSVIEDGQKIDLKMTLEDGTVTDVKDNGPPPGADRVPLTTAHAQGVLDPLTALLMPDEGGEASCNRTLAIFDGRRRYDLALSFKRTEKVRGSEAAVVCNVVLRPIAGHRADSMIMKYVADRRDMELAFAPITGTRFLAPLRLLVPSLIGTMAVQAASFEVSPVAPRQ